MSFLDKCHVYTEKGQKCVFPFRYNGRLYHSCTVDESNESPKSWCATDVKKSDKTQPLEILSSSSWDYCEYTDCATSSLGTYGEGIRGLT